MRCQWRPLLDDRRADKACYHADMPIYEYEHDEKTPKGCDKVFEVLQNVSEAPLTSCPTCSKKVHRILSVARGMIDRLSGSELRDKGLKKFVRRDKGVYEQE